MTVVECGTMGKAAERLAISQPVVSKAIADMEHALAVRLLDRSQRGVEPTPYGRALIKRGIAIFDEMRQGIEEIEFLSDPTAGVLGYQYSQPSNYCCRGGTGRSDASGGGLPSVPESSAASGQLRSDSKHCAAGTAPE